MMVIQYSYNLTREAGNMRYLIMVIIFFTQPCYAFAGEVKHGDWITVQADNGDGIAVTTNGTGFNNALGMRCLASNQECVQFLVSDVHCGKGDKIPILANFAKGSLFITGMCTYNNDTHKYELYLDHYRELHSALEANDVVGFALPMKSGAFQAIRFSLNGSKAAMDQAENIASHKQSIPGGNVTQSGSGFF